MRALIIHNPRSGFGSDAVFEFERSLLREGDECTVRILSRDFRTREAVADAASYDVVVLSGGDSTVTSLMHALIGTDVPVCVFPSGTENLLSATIGNAPEPAALARACRVGKTALLDLTRTSWLATDGTRHTSGVGLLAGVGYDMQLLHSSLTAPGTFGNAFFFATTLQSTHPTVASIQVTVDGQEHSYRGISCLVLALGFVKPLRHNGGHTLIGMIEGLPQDAWMSEFVSTPTAAELQDEALPGEEEDVLAGTEF